MFKSILYTSNPDFVPVNFDQIWDFAEKNNKFYSCYFTEGSEIGNLKKGAHVLTSKGNNVYVLDVSDYGEEFEAKKCNITGIVKVDYPFTENKPIINKQLSNNSVCKSVKGISSRLKEMFMPSEAKNVRITTDGNICVATNQGYVSIDADNNLTSYPEELTLDLPVFVVSKPKDQLKEGDVIALDRNYAKVVKIADNKITVISYTGAGKTIHTIKDFLFNQTMVRVVVSVAGNVGGQINPMMLMMMSEKEDKSSLFPLLMMNQNGGTLRMNPMMAMMLMKDNNSSMKDLLMMSALSGNNFFGNMFKTADNSSIKESETTENPE